MLPYRRSVTPVLLNLLGLSDTLRNSTWWERRVRCVKGERGQGRTSEIGLDLGDFLVRKRRPPFRNRDHELLGLGAWPPRAVRALDARRTWKVFLLVC